MGSGDLRDLFEGWLAKGFRTPVEILVECSNLIGQIDSTLEFVPASTETREYAILGSSGKPLIASPEGRGQRLRLEARRDRKGIKYLKISALIGSVEKTKWADQLTAAQFRIFAREDPQRRDYLAFGVDTPAHFREQLPLMQALFKFALASK